MYHAVAAWPELLQGLFNTLVLSALAMAIGMVVSVAGALGKTSGPKSLRWIIDEYDRSRRPLRLK